MEFYQPRKAVDATRHKLPHWQQGECAVAITVRLADSLPQEKLDLWKREREDWLLRHPPPWSAEQDEEYHQNFTSRIQRWLDAGHGSCVLKSPAVAQETSHSLGESAKNECELWSWVVMPNHVHVLLSLLVEARLPEFMKQWKGSSSRAINLRLGRRGRLWQPDYFDRLVRSQAHFVTCLNYIRDNPQKAKLREGEYLWWERPGVRETLEQGGRGS